MGQSPAVERALEEGFAAADRFRAREVLPAVDQFRRGSPYERIVIAIIQLASGDVGKLQYFADEATKDWRDVLYWAESPRTADEPKSWEELQERLGLDASDRSTEPDRGHGTANLGPR